MIQRAIKGKKFKFRDSFNELTVGVFSDFIDTEAELATLETEEAELDKQIKKLKKTSTNDDFEREIIFLDSQLVDIDWKIRAKKLQLLILLAYEPKRLNRYLKYVTHDFIDRVMGEIHSKIKGFDTWVNSVKLVSKFRFKDYKKPNFWSVSKIVEFEVFDNSKTTVLRDAAANIVARKLDDVSTKFSKNKWGELAKFVAYVSRPALEKEETPVSNKKGFLKRSSVIGLNLDDRLKAYNDLLAETVEQRADIFRNLPLIIAIGVYKQYFFLSRR